MRHLSSTKKAKKPKKMKGGDHGCGTSHHGYQAYIGGSHCNTAKGHEKKRKPRKSKRRPRKPKKMKGGQCSDSCSGCPS